MEIILKKSQTCTIILEYSEFQLTFQILNVLINHFRLMMVQSTIILRSWVRAQHGTYLKIARMANLTPWHTHTHRPMVSAAMAKVLPNRDSTLFAEFLEAGWMLMAI